MTEAETAADQARAVPAHADPLLAVIADTTAGRTGHWLDQLAASDALPEHHRVALAADDARTCLDQLLRTVELAGHDPAQVLRDAVTSSSLDGAASVAQVLHFRIRTALECKLDPRVASFADLLPRELPEADRAGLERLAAAADARRARARHAAGRGAAGVGPGGAGPHTGPGGGSGRAGGVGAQGRVGRRHREWADHGDDAAPLGAAPPAGLAEKHAVFRAAHAALDLSTAGAEEEAMSEGRLRAVVAAWEREQRVAPRYVADQLEAAHDELRKARTDATVWAARADAETDPLEADQLRAAAMEAAERVEQLAPIVADLTFSDDARVAWRYETAVLRDKAERCRYAAGMRGIDLDDPGERVTAQEWFDAHAAPTLAEDADRVITEHDLDLHDVDGTDDDSTDEPLATELHPAAERDDGTEQDDDTGQPGSRRSDDPDTAAGEARRSAPPNDEEPAVTSHDEDREGKRPTRDRQDDRSADDPSTDDRSTDDRGVDVRGDADVVLEPAPPDIRETSVPDPTERSDPQQRRRVPLPDEATATLERARLVLAEIEQQRAAEAAEHARATEKPPDDELDRWVHHDDPWGHHEGRSRGGGAPFHRWTGHPRGCHAVRRASVKFVAFWTG
jgi:hypothetical protein